MEWLFGKRVTPDQMLRRNQRCLNKAMRDLDRERAKMEQQEKRVICDIKRLAKENQMDAVKVMAKDLVRTRNHVKKFMLMRANIQAVSLKITTLKSQSSMAQSMQGVARAMGMMNSRLKMPQIEHLMQEFMKNSEIMDMKEDMIDESLDDALGNDDDEVETDELVSQVMNELGIETMDQLSGLPAPSGKVGTDQARVADDDLAARLDKLRNA